MPAIKRVARWRLYQVLPSLKGLIDRADCATASPKNYCRTDDPPPGGNVRPVQRQVNSESCTIILTGRVYPFGHPKGTQVLTMVHAFGQELLQPERGVVPNQVFWQRSTLD